METNAPLVGNANAMQSLFAYVKELNVLFHRIQGNSTFVVQDSSAAYLPIEIKNEYIETDSSNLLYIQGRGLEQPDQTLMMYNLPSCYRFIAGIFNVRLKGTADGRNHYFNAKLQYGNNYGSSSILSTLRAYSVSHGLEQSMLFFHQSRRSKPGDDAARLLIEGYSDQQYDNAELLLFVQP